VSLESIKTVIDKRYNITRDFRKKVFRKIGKISTYFINFYEKIANKLMLQAKIIADRFNLIKRV
jgi:hypothetical protein